MPDKKIAGEMPLQNASSQDLSKEAAGSFDYIVVGAGSAGCVLAERLSASGKHRVLLIEAGGRDRNIWIHIPLGYGKLFTDARVNWLYQSEPEPELYNRRIIQPRGKVLGGTSSMNAMVWVRGSKLDYDDWDCRDGPGMTSHRCSAAWSRTISADPGTELPDRSGSPR